MMMFILNSLCWTFRDIFESHKHGNIFVALLARVDLSVNDRLVFHPYYCLFRPPIYCR